MGNVVWKKNYKDTTFKPATMKSHKVLAQTTTTHRDPNNVAQKPTVTHKGRKLPQYFL